MDGIKFTLTDVLLYKSLAQLHKEHFRIKSFPFEEYLECYTKGCKLSECECPSNTGEPVAYQLTFRRVDLEVQVIFSYSDATSIGGAYIDSRLTARLSDDQWYFKQIIADEAGFAKFNEFKTNFADFEHLQNCTRYDMQICENPEEFDEEPHEAYGECLAASKMFKEALDAWSIKGDCTKAAR